MNHLETSDLPDRPSGPREESFSVTSHLFELTTTVFQCRAFVNRFVAVKSQITASLQSSAALCVLTLDTSHFSPHLAGKLLPWHPGLTDSCHRELVCVYKYVCVCVSECGLTCVCVCVCVLHSSKWHVKWEQGEATETLWCVCGRRLDDGGGMGLLVGEEEEEEERKLERRGKTPASGA